MTAFDLKHHPRNRMAYRLWLGTALSVAVLVAVTGCGGKPPKIEPPAPAPVLRVDVSAAANANAAASAKGLPIVVRLYELKSAGGFRGADFFSLYDREAEILGDDLIARQELTLAPGQSRQVSRPLSPEARYLGVVGAYRDIDRAQWRQVAPLGGDGKNALAVFVGADAIRIEPL
jgi:type VI secretion system protein VasD